MDAFASQVVFGLRGESQVSHHGDSGRNYSMDLWQYAAPTFQLHRVSSGTNQGDGGLHRLFGAGFVAAKRQVRQNQRPLGASGYGRGGAHLVL